MEWSSYLSNGLLIIVLTIVVTNYLHSCRKSTTFLENMLRSNYCYHASVQILNPFTTSILKILFILNFAPSPPFHGYIIN